jgi:hypothetical protein
MIFTLPITVTDGAPLGYWLTSILADALSKQHQEQGILFYGQLGLRSPTPLMEKTFHERLDFLNLTCERMADGDFKDELLELSREVFSSGTIEYRKQECYRCPCGRLELPTHIASYAKDKTFTRSEGAYLCRACGKPGEIAQVSCGFFQAQAIWSWESVHVYPEWYRGELNELVRQLRDQGIPMVRTRDTGLSQGGLNLDAEFVWSLIPLLLSRRHPDERIRLVVTNHVLRQATVALLLAQALNPNLKADLIVSPIISHPGADEKWNIGRLVELGFTGDLLRIMLVGSLGWQSKYAGLYDAPSSIEHRRFMLLQRRIQEARKGETKSFTSHEVLRNLSHQNLMRGLKHVFNPGRFDYQSLIGVL